MTIQTQSRQASSATGASAVSVRELTKVFRTRGAGAGAGASGGHRAVDALSFELEAGGSLGIVGESGSGKTTIARMLIGLERATGGSMAVLGRDRSAPARGSAERNRRARELQIVFQDPYTSLDPSQSARAAVDEVLRHHTGMSATARAARLSDLMNQVGLTERQANAKPRDLSGGQRQRVAIARALAADPGVLILDEAVSALDVSIQAQILNLLVDIRAATGLTYVLISHDLAVVRQLCDTVLVLRRGKVVEHGECERILDDPAEEYTRALRAAVPTPGWRPPAR